MTINKLTSNVQPLSEVDKINETIQLLNGETSFTNSIKSTSNHSIKLESNGEAFVATAKRTDNDNFIKFGIGIGGEKRGIWDEKHHIWAFNVAGGKAYALGKEIATKSDLHPLKSYSDEGELLTDEEGLADIKKYAHSTFGRSKLTISGSPNITNDGIASGFSASNNVTSSFTSVTPTQSIILRTTGVYSSTANTANGSQVLTKIVGVNSYPSIEYLKSRNELSATRFHNNSNSNNQSAKISVNLNDGDIVETEVIATASYVTLNAKINGVSYTNTWSGNGLYSGAISGWKASDGSNWFWTGSIDLKYSELIIDGIYIFSGNKTGTDSYIINGSTVTIPYTISKTGSKIVDSYYRTQVASVYNAFGYAPYYTLSDTDFTLPQGELYGMIQRLSALPSPKYETLTLAASGSEYTMPSNGWLVLSKRAGANNQYIIISNTTLGIPLEYTGVYQNNRVSLFLPVRKDDVISISYSLSGDTTMFRFYYSL